MKGNRIQAMVFAAGLAACFFLPWFVPTGRDVFAIKHLTPGTFNIAGFEVNRYHLFLAAAGKSLGALLSKTPPAYYAVFLIPALGIFNFISALMGKANRLVCLLAGALPLAGLVWLVLNFGGGVFKYFTFGAYLTLVCGLGLVVAAITPGGGRK